MTSPIPLSVLLFARFFFPAIVAAVLITSCSKNNDETDPPDETTVHVNKVVNIDTAVILLRGQTSQLSATVDPANATNGKINWRSNDEIIAKVNQSGLITALAEGTAYIIASSDEYPVISDTTIVYVLRQYDVYICGSANTEQWLNAGVVWTNGVVAALGGGYGNVAASATAITVSNGNVYVAGTTLNQWNWDVATYWKNGMAVQVSDPLAGFDHFVNGMVADGDNIYITGYDFQTYGCPTCFYGSKAHYWKVENGQVTEVPLYDGTNNTVSTRTYAIARSGQDIYIAGSQANDNFSSIVKYWRNNFANGVELTANSWGLANSIAFRGNEIILAGFDGCPNFGCIKTAKLWNSISSNVLSLTNGARDAEATCVTVSGNTIYAGGYEKNGAGKMVAKCWITDGTVVKTIDLSNGESDAMIKGITIKDDHIFLCGYEVNQSTGYREAKYWRVYHNMAIDVTYYPQSTVPGHAEANGIFVK